MSSRKFPIGDMSDDEVEQMLGIPTAELIAEVEASITRALDIFASHFNRSFNRPAVTYDLSGHTAGYANSKRIRLNTELLYSHHDEMINRTIPHEVAHYVQFEVYPDSKAHGAEWQFLMYILGLPPDVTHTYATTAARVRKREYTYYCDCGEHMVTKTIHNRIQQGRIYTCRKCKTQLRKGGEN